MPITKLEGCTATPLGSYLKSLGVLRLVWEQADRRVRGWWDAETFIIESTLAAEELLQFFMDEYRPTPIVAPWNGGSGFYPKDNKEGIDAITGCALERFAEYRAAISACKAFPEVQAGKVGDEEERRTAILRRCRNGLSDRAVEWMDAAIGIDANGERSFPPVLGTGGNEGRLDYTNNFMSRLAALLISPSRKTPVRELLANALFAKRTESLQPGAAGQYDPGRAGGANQGPGVAHDAPTNPWDLVLTLEGAVAWASGLYRRQGVACRAILCSPFTVYSRKVGYGSRSKEDDARAEIWTPLWSRPVGFPELKALLREGRASVEGRPARDTLGFAAAASSLGVDRGIDRFVRYSLLKRRGDSYVALPTGSFPVYYHSKADRIREFQGVLDKLPELSKGTEDLLRNVETALYETMRANNRQSLVEIMSALGALLRRIATATNEPVPVRELKARPWLEACDFETMPEVRIAAALASIWAPHIGGVAENLSRAGNKFAWTGVDLPARLVSVLDRRLQCANAAELGMNPIGGSCAIDPGDATRFIEGTVDDALIERLVFAFLVFDWQDFKPPQHPSAEALPVYAVLKCLFLPGEIRRNGEEKRLVADSRILSLLTAGFVDKAAEIAVNRLRIAGLRPLLVDYAGGVDCRRLAASLSIPVRQKKLLECGIFEREQDAANV